MGSSFFELNIGVSGLFAAQRGLSVTSNNITNATTPGYSRQVMGQQASRALAAAGNGMLGTGVDTTYVKRVRDSYLDVKLWNQNPSLGEYTMKNQQNALVESVFGEPSDAGFTTMFNDVFTAIDNLAKSPNTGETQSALRQVLISFTKYYNNASASLQGFQKDLNFEVKSKVDEINMLATRIQSLNKQINQAEMHGGYANSLRDDRDLCVDRLSKLINIEAKEVEVPKEDGTIEKQFLIKANGQTLVDHYFVRTLEVAPRKEKVNPEDADGLYEVQWSDKTPFDMGDSGLSGELKGAIDMRDGRGTGRYDANDPDSGTPPVTYNGIPYYISRLDSFVQTFAQKMNEIYNKDSNGNQLEPPEHAPQYLFEVPDGDYSKLTAANFSISKAIYESAENIRTNFEHIPDLNGGGDNPNPSNNDLLLELLALKDDKNFFKEGDPKDYMISIFSELGINAQEAKMFATSQSNITNMIQNQREAVSAVDTNEEFMNLIKYNQAYQAAAKIISTMDGIYETTIFKLGSW